MSINKYWLMPRLSPLAVSNRIELLTECETPLVAQQYIIFSGKPIIYGETGGQRITKEDLEGLRSDLVSIAEKCGYPAPGTRDSRARFDALCGEYLYQDSGIPVGEALRDDVWACMATCLAPDIVIWRFSKPTKKRYTGGIRNTFQRLWLRAAVLDRGEGSNDRWRLLTVLPEDTLVQITERPAIGGNPKLAKSIGEAWLRASDEIPSNLMEGVTRHAIKSLRVLNVVQCLSSLKPDALTNICVKAFMRSYASLTDDLGKIHK